MTADRQNRGREAEEQEMESFFRLRAAWKPGDPLPTNTAKIAKGYIRPILADGTYWNLLHHHYDSEAKQALSPKAVMAATSGKKAFAALLARYECDEDHRLTVLDTIVNVMFPNPVVDKTSVGFYYKNNEAACKLFAQRAAAKVTEILCAWARHQQTTGVLQDTVIDPSADDDRHILEILWMLPKCLDKALGKRDSTRFMILTILKVHYDYETMVRLCPDDQPKQQFALAWESIRRDWHNKVALPHWQVICAILLKTPSAKSLKTVYNRTKARFKMMYPRTPECDNLAI